MAKGISFLFYLTSIILSVTIVYLHFIYRGTFTGNLTVRRSVKHFSTGFIDTEPIKAAIINSPSSFGLQPYNVIAVTDPEVKRTLSEACFNQPQINECYTLFIFCAFQDVNERIEEFIGRTKAEHLRPKMMGFFEKCPDVLSWSKNQAYIALGFAIAAAAEKNIACCPMEGFIPSKVAAILGLKENIEPCVLLAAGNEGDNSDLPPRFRFQQEELLFEK